VTPIVSYLKMGFLVFICSICGKYRVEIYKSPVQFSNKLHLQFGHV